MDSESLDARMDSPAGAEPEESISPNSDIHTARQTLAKTARAVYEKYRPQFESYMETVSDDQVQASPAFVEVENLISANIVDAQKVLDIINEARPVQPESAFDDAPFKGYKDNTDEAWEYVSDEEIREYLGEKYFLPKDILRQIQEDISAAATIRTDDKEQGVEIQTGLFCHAMGFNSWLGRGSEENIMDGLGSKSVDSCYYNDGGKDPASIDVMKHYASLPTKLPPIGLAQIFIQPNGLVFATNGPGGDSHRIGAAMLRGDKNINCEQVEICLLNSNFFIEEA